MLTEDQPEGSGTFRCVSCIPSGLALTFADPNVRFDRLHDLAADGLLEDIKAMKPDSTAVNSRDDYGFTPLHLAADRGHASVVHCLIENGADCSLTVSRLSR